MSRLIAALVAAAFAFGTVPALSQSKAEDTEKAREARAKAKQERADKKAARAAKKAERKAKKAAAKKDEPK
jgi:Ni/Co efflux regulator RcnB